MNKLPLKSIPLSSLVVGMYITKLEIPWMDSPFLSHNRLIKSQQDIDQLNKSGASSVTIDPNKSADTAENPATKPLVKHPAQGLKKASAAKSKTLTTAARGETLEAEISEALNIRDTVRKALASTLDELAAGNAVNRDQLSPLIDQTLESLERHNQALLNLAHMSRRTQKLADHAFSTCCIVLNLAQIQKVNQSDLESLGIAALLHEAGWAQIPTQLMGKRTQYSQIERKLIQKHTELGVKILTKCEVSELTQRIIAEHHELCNGKGYPNHLTADNIHPLSKLFSVVDRYDELVHQLTDQPGMITSNALRTLYVDAKKNIYDQQSVAQLISLLGVYPISSVVKLTNGAVGIVREINPDGHLYPLVEIHVDENGKVLDTPTLIDLSKGHEKEGALAIDSVIDPKTTTDPVHKRLVLNV